MNTNFKINHLENKIVVSKKIANMAERYGTPEYCQLQEVRKDYPDFTVSIDETKSNKKDSMKGLTYDFMKKYIESHDSDGQIMEEYMILLALDKVSKEIGAVAASYGEIRSWFMKSFPEIQKFLDTREKILNKNVSVDKISAS